jgi:crotonobetainyl-CoA:carnitine CoA-transferase CaiB-like acyl-CoA transferase
VFEVAPAAEGHKDHIILAVGNDGQYAKFCQVAGRPELATDPRFAKNQDRVRNRAVLVPMLEEVMKTRRKADWLAALEAAKVPCGAINDIGEVFADPHVRERGMVHAWEHPLAGSLNLVASPLKLSGTPVRTDLPPPLLGQHTEQVLGEVLGWSEERIRELRGREVI